MKWFKSEALIALCKLNLYVYDPITFKQLAKHQAKQFLHFEFLPLQKKPRFASFDITMKKIRIFQFKENFCKLEHLSTITLPFEGKHLFQFSPHSLAIIQAPEIKDMPLAQIRRISDANDMEMKMLTVSLYQTPKINFKIDTDLSLPMKKYEFSVDDSIQSIISQFDEFYPTSKTIVWWEHLSDFRVLGFDFHKNEVSHLMVQVSFQRRKPFNYTVWHLKTQKVELYLPQKSGDAAVKAASI
ncbi:hypothetical protein FGO68_gene10763 [Halteria grandinella]|uniref:Uncharacterized protein n=1 Tax=Halteria grandinella TaxID=5974 RepID=A0A8J8SV72_HALGN|nr:hypothetical protein FGO68_gene10763 [Halteria grandinella]